MHFVIEDVWEVHDPLVKSLQVASGSRLFPCVEVDLNGPIWHVDLQFQIDDGIAHWRRFILASIEQVAATLEEYQGLSRLHLQSARTLSAPVAYELWPVLSLEVGHDQRGHQVYVVKLPHGKLNYPNCGTQESAAISPRVIYEAPAA